MSDADAVQRIRAVAARRDRARMALEAVTGELRAAVLEAVNSGRASEAGAAREAGVGRMTVRKWRAEARAAADVAVEV